MAPSHREREINRPLRIDFFEGANQGFDGGRDLGDAAECPRPDRDPGAVEVIGNLIAHDRRLLLDLAASGPGSTAASLMITLSGVFERMGEIADLGARALHDVAIGADQQIELACERRDDPGENRLRSSRLRRAVSRRPLPAIARAVSSHSEAGPPTKPREPAQAPRR